MRRDAWRAIGLFLLMTAALSAVFETLMGRMGMMTHYLVMGVMWCPGVSAIATSLILGRGVRSLPWRWPPARWVLAAWLLPMGYGLVVYLPVWLLHVGGSGFGNAGTLAQWSREILGKGQASLPAALFYLLLLATLGVISSAANALGEEIGWRGFLVWEMRKVMPFWGVGLGSGLIWSLWHYPGILLTDYSAGEGSRWLQVSLFTVSVTSMGVVFAYFAFKTNSLWTTVVLHASHNCLIQRVYTPLTVKGPGTHLYIDEFGCLLPIASILLAAYFMRRARVEGMG